MNHRLYRRSKVLNKIIDLVCLLMKNPCPEAMKRGNNIRYRFSGLRELSGLSMVSKQMSSNCRIMR